MMRTLLANLILTVAAVSIVGCVAGEEQLDTRDEIRRRNPGTGTRAGTRARTAAAAAAAAAAGLHAAAQSDVFPGSGAR